MHTDILAMLAAGPAAKRLEAPEEWAIFDHEGFGPLSIGEYEPIEQVSRLAQAIAEHGPALAACAALDVANQEHPENFGEAYIGQFSSLADFARELVDDLGYERLLDDVLPDRLRSYVQIDCVQLGRGLQLAGEIDSADDDNGGVFVFRTDI